MFSIIERAYALLKDYASLKANAQLITILVVMVILFASVNGYLIKHYVSDAIHWRNKYDELLIQQTNERMETIIRTNYKNDSILSANYRLKEEIKELLKKVK